MDKKQGPLDQLRQDPQAAALLGDQAAVRDILRSREAKQVAGIFQAVGGDQLREATQSAAAGDGAKLQAILAQVLSDPQGAQAMEALRRKSGR